MWRLSASIDEVILLSGDFAICFFMYSYQWPIDVLLLHGLHARSCSLLERNVVYCADRFNGSVNDLVYGRLPIIVNSYVRNSVDETTLDRVDT